MPCAHASLLSYRQVGRTALAFFSSSCRSGPETTGTVRERDPDRTYHDERDALELRCGEAGEHLVVAAQELHQKPFETGQDEVEREQHPGGEAVAHPPQPPGDEAHAHRLVDRRRLDLHAR